MVMDNVPGLLHHAVAVPPAMQLSLQNQNPGTKVLLIVMVQQERIFVPVAPTEEDMGLLYMFMVSFSSGRS